MTTYRLPELSTFEFQQAIIDKDLATPPGSPSEGDRYIVAATATGDWVGEENSIAWFDGSSWVFDTPTEGFLLWVSDEDKHYKFDGTSWSVFADIDDLDDVQDGSTYGRVKLTELTTGFVNRLNDGSNVVTAAQAKEAYDRRASYNANLKAVIITIA